MKSKFSSFSKMMLVVAASFLIGFLSFAGMFRGASVVFDDFGEGIYKHYSHAVDVGGEALFYLDKYFGEGVNLVLDRKVSSASDSIEYIERNAQEDNGVRRIQRGSIQEWSHDIKTEEKAILANLEDMKISLYEGGEVAREFKILSIGRPGSPWETPSGKYKIMHKEENHFSSIGHVYMPWSMQFFGNFFIHGWPYYPNGTPVPEGYSGGCIRLSEQDAQVLFEEVGSGVPVIVLGDDRIRTQRTGNPEVKEFYQEDEGVDIDVSAQSFLVADLDTGEVILERARKQVRPIASISKLMTALVSLEVVNQYQEIRIPKTVIETEGYSGGLLENQRIMTGDLIYPLLMESSNDAAEALAYYYGRDRFISQLNNRADSIGLSSTFFEDPSGLSELNVSSAEDLFRLAQNIHFNKNHIFELTLLKSYDNGSQAWNNSSKLLEDERYLGGKVGYTDEAGKTMLALFQLPLAEFEDRNIAIILLSSDDINTDIYEIVDYLEKHVSYKIGV